jgi:hypothetical protein
MIKIYWVATYGNMGLEVEHFTSERLYKIAIKQAEEEHRSGHLDSYTHGEEIVNLTPKLR